MEKTEAIERLEYLKAKAQLALEQEVPEWIAEDVLGTIEAYDIAIEALQTENSSEKPNNSTISKMEQVETMSCQECKHFHENAVMYLDQCDFCFKDCKYEPKDEPQTERSE